MDWAELNCTKGPSGFAAIGIAEAEQDLNDIPGWELKDNGRRIERVFKFHDFKTAWQFVVRVAAISEQQEHYPEVHFGWSFCAVSFVTETINGLHENDFIMAAKVNRLAEEPEFKSELRI